jgi:hypothetical protein
MSFHLDPDILFSTLFSGTLKLCFSSNVGEKFYTQKKQHIKLVLSVLKFLNRRWENKRVN